MNAQPALYNTNKDLLSRFFTISFFTILFYFMINISVAHAADDNTNQISIVLCNAIDLLTGAIGKTITVIIIISLGIMLLLGKVTWGVAIALAIGIGVIFGSTEFVQLLSGDSSFDCKTIINQTK